MRVLRLIALGRLAERLLLSQDQTVHITKDGHNLRLVIRGEWPVSPATARTVRETWESVSSDV